MSAAGSAAKRQASIDPRNYGVRNFPTLFAAVGLFEIVKAENGQAYVADRREQGPDPRTDTMRAEGRGYLADRSSGRTCSAGLDLP